ncbi:MAG: hypothetical protein ACYSUK_00075 [Planctomycetota bacterium]|jgi:hypothetical protein
MSLNRKIDMIVLRLIQFVISIVGLCLIWSDQYTLGWVLLVFGGLCDIKCDMKMIKSKLGIME